jgi:cysteine synthase
MIARSVLDLIGRTPMVKINKLVSSEDAELLAKLEWYNPGGSVKDRMALYLVEAAEASGRLRKDKVIIEATSGNTGIALAMIAAVKGYRIVVVMPESVSIERRKIIRAYGADLILSPGEKGTAGAIELKRRIIEEDPEKYVDLDQFSDPANIMAHYQTTAREIIEQTSGKVDMVVVGIGTAGTGVGISMGLKEYKKRCEDSWSHSKTRYQHTGAEKSSRGKSNKAVQARCLRRDSGNRGSQLNKAYGKGACEKGGAFSRPEFCSNNGCCCEEGKGDRKREDNCGSSA